MRGARGRMTTRRRRNSAGNTRLWFCPVLDAEPFDLGKGPVACDEGHVLRESMDANQKIKRRQDPAARFHMRAYRPIVRGDGAIPIHDIDPAQNSRTVRLSFRASGRRSRPNRNSPSVIAEMQRESIGRATTCPTTAT